MSRRLLSTRVSPMQKSPLSLVNTKAHLPLAGVYGCVRVFNEEGNVNASAPVEAALRRLGAEVARGLGSEVTHVVWKNGTRAQWKQISDLRLKQAETGLKMVKLVSPLWVEACRETRRRVNETTYLVKAPPSDRALSVGRSGTFDSLSASGSMSSSCGAASFADEPEPVLPKKSVGAEPHPRAIVREKPRQKRHQPSLPTSAPDEQAFHSSQKDPDAVAEEHVARVVRDQLVSAQPRLGSRGPLDPKPINDEGTTKASAPAKFSRKEVAALIPGSHVCVRAGPKRRYVDGVVDRINPNGTFDIEFKRSKHLRRMPRVAKKALFSPLNPDTSSEEEEDEDDDESSVSQSQASLLSSQPGTNSSQPASQPKPAKGVKPHSDGKSASTVGRAEWTEPTLVSQSSTRSLPEGDFDTMSPSLISSSYLRRDSDANNRRSGIRRSNSSPASTSSAVSNHQSGSALRPTSDKVDNAARANEDGVRNDANDDAPLDGDCILAEDTQPTQPTQPMQLASQLSQVTQPTQLMSAQSQPTIGEGSPNVGGSTIRNAPNSRVLVAATPPGHLTADKSRLEPVHLGLDGVASQSAESSSQPPRKILSVPEPAAMHHETASQQANAVDVSESIHESSRTASASPTKCAVETKSVHLESEDSGVRGRTVSDHAVQGGVPTKNPFVDSSDFNATASISHTPSQQAQKVDGPELIREPGSTASAVSQPRANDHNFEHPESDRHQVSGSTPADHTEQDQVDAKDLTSADHSDSDASSSTRQSSQWGCSACSFLNDCAMTLCEMCGTRRPSTRATRAAASALLAAGGISVTTKKAASARRQKQKPSNKPATAKKPRGKQSSASEGGVGFSIFEEKECDTHAAGTQSSVTSRAGAARQSHGKPCDTSAANDSTNPFIRTSTKDRPALATKSPAKAASSENRRTQANSSAKKTKTASSRLTPTKKKAKASANTATVTPLKLRVVYEGTDAGRKAFMDDITGVYVLQTKSARRARVPTWKREDSDFYIFQTQPPLSQRWRIGDKSDMKAGACIIKGAVSRKKTPLGGKKSWELYLDDAWHKDSGIQIQEIEDASPRKEDETRSAVVQSVSEGATPSTTSRTRTKRGISTENVPRTKRTRKDGAGTKHTKTDSAGMRDKHASSKVRAQVKEAVPGRSSCQEPVLVASRAENCTDGATFLQSAITACGGHGSLARARELPTHLVVGGSRRTLKVLQALARGIWILSPGWVYDSIRQGYWVREDEYEVVGCFPGAGPARQRRQGRNGGGIFKGLTFAIPKAPSVGPSRRELGSLIEMADGGLEPTEETAQYIIVSPDDPNMNVDAHAGSASPRPKYVTPTWVLDSIASASLLPIDSESRVDEHESDAME